MKQVVRIKVWLEKMRIKNKLKRHLGMGRTSWFNLIQFEQWSQHWVKRHRKCRELTTFEEIVLQKEYMAKYKIMKGTVENCSVKFIK